MPDLEKKKTRNINIHTQALLRRLYEISENYPLFSKSNLIELKHKFLCPTVELGKLSMSSDYVLLTFIKSKIKYFCISCKGKLC